MNDKKKKTLKQKETIRNFILSEIEINMLRELEELLSHFEWMTNEFQSNEVSSSKVYPCIMTLKHRIMHNINDCIYTEQLRKDLVTSNKYLKNYNKPV
jgi:thioredoxin-related protein